MIFSKWNVSVGIVAVAFAVNAQWIEQTEPLPIAPEMALLVTGPISPEDSLSLDELGNLSPVSGENLQMRSMSFPEANPDASLVATLAEQLESYDKMFIYVCDRIKTEPYRGLIRSPEQTLLDGAGSPMEQAHLFSELCRAKYGSGATKFLEQTLTIPLQSDTAFDACDFTGVSNSTDAVNLLLNGNLLVSVTNTTVTIPWVLVGLQTTGGWYYFDPSLKTHAVPDSFDFYATMGYSRTNLLASAGGTTNGAGWATSLNEGAITNLMNQYASGLSTVARTNSALLVEPGRILSAVRWAAGPLTMVPPYSNIADIATNSHGRIVLSGGGLSPAVTFNTRETAHKKISIRFTTDGSYKAQIYLGDSASPVRTESSGGAYNTPFNLTVDTIHAGVTNSQPYSLKRGAGQYVLCQSFGGGCSSAMSGYISKTIAALKQRGYADNSPEIFTESLRYTGQRWMDQEANVQRYIQAISPKKTVVKYRIGIMAGETEGFYIDAKNGYTFSAGNGSGFIDSYVASALEHAVLEQLQPGNAKGISTIRIIKQANATNMPVYRANSNNWNAIKNNISNYSNKAQIESDIQNASGFFILPQSGSIAMGTNWSGNGYVMSKKVGTSTAYGMMIGGGYNGGYNAWKNPYVPKIQQTYTKPVYIPPIKTYSPPKSFDPVDMQSGAFLFDHTDLSLNGPLPLNLHRSYRSDNNTESVMGSGWNHSFNIYAAEHSAIDQSVGERSTEDMVPLLAGMAVIRNLLDNETGAKDWVAAAIVADWTVQQLTGNGVSVSLGSKALTFVKQPDGSYTPPPGMTVSLSKTNGVYVMQERNASTYTFNTNNLIDTISDPDGNTLTFSYNAQTNLQTVTSSFGPQMTFVYTSNRVTSVSDSARTVYYQYDAKNNLTNFTDAAGKNWGIAYSNTNHPNAITSLKDPEGIVTIRNYYNAFGQVTNQISATGQSYDLFITDYISVERDPLGYRTAYVYDTKGRTVQTQRPDGVIRYSRYDGWDRITNTVNEAGITNVFIYDVNHNLLQTREAVGTPQERATGYGYDSLNRLRFVTNALGTTEQVVTEYTYTATHHVDTETQAKGKTEQRITDYDYYANGLLQTKTEPLRVTSYTYDSRGNPNTVTSTDAGTVDYDFSAAGLLERVEDQNQVVTKYGYNALGLLTNTIYAFGTPLQTSESQTYYGNGLLYTVTDSRGRSTTNTWTAAYKPATSRYPDGGMISNTYDAADRLVKVKDARNNVVTNTLDAIGRVTYRKGLGSGGTEQRFFYDVAGNVTNSTVDPSGLNLWRKTSYDALNRPLNQQSAIADQQFQYDGLSRLTNRVDPASKAWKTEYDALGRVKKALRPSGATEQFVYDALGHRVGFYNAEGKPVTFGVDAQGRVTAITNAIGKATSFTYNDAGNLTDRLSAKNETTHYDYNALNRLTNIVHEGQWTASFAYDGNGNIVTQASPLALSSFSYDSMNRLSSSLISINAHSFAVTNSYDLNGNRTNIIYPGGLTVGYSYDAENRLTGTTVTGSPIPTPLAFSFGCDGAGRMNTISFPNGVNSSFGYDAESRVINYVHGAFLNHTIIRDPRGFKTQEDIYAGLVPNFTNGLRQTRTHNDADQLLSAGANEYSYDPNGNLTNSANGIYQWNYDNRLVNAGSTEYLYDGSGSRIGRIANGVTNYFILDYKAPLKMPLAETDAQGNITRYYIWSSHGLLAHLDMNPTNGAIVATRYYHADEQGSTLAMTDESGAVTEQFAYSPYGQTIGHTGTNSTPYQWLGGLAVRNEGNGLYYMLNRYYSADMRRFISADPSGIDGGANLYAYCGNNPLAFVDPYGLCAESWSSKAYNSILNLRSNHEQSERNYAQKTAAYYNSMDYRQYSTTIPHAIATGIANVNEAIGTKLAVATMAYSFATMPPSVSANSQIYRQGTFADESVGWGGNYVKGKQWATENPLTTSGYAQKYGLPAENLTPHWVVGGRAPAGASTRWAPPSHNNPANTGGGLEVLPTVPNTVQLDWFHMP